MSTPSLKVVAPVVSEEDLHLKPQPVIVYGAVSEDDFNDLVQRVEALESAANAG